MRSLPKVTFLADDFAPGTPSQQLLDRFLIGYNRDGQFHTPGCAVELISGASATEQVSNRVEEFGLKIATTPDQSQCAVVFDSLEKHLLKLPPAARCFVYGKTADSGARAVELRTAAAERGIALRSATAVSAAFQLPVINVPSRVSKALAVSFASFPDADLEAVEALWGLASPPNDTVKIELLSGDALWRRAYSVEWISLFAAAFSRSNTIQGDPLKDGRTQDVVGLRLVEKLVAEPRAWILEQPNGLKMAVFILNGALEDLNVAFGNSSEAIVSTQLYRPPKPLEDHFSALAGQIEDFFRQDTAPKPNANIVLLPAIYEKMTRAWNARI